MPCHFYVYDLLDQYWEKLEDLPFGKGIPYPMVTAIDKKENSYLFVVSHNTELFWEEYAALHTGSNVYRIGLGSFLYNSWETIELNFSSHNLVWCADNIGERIFFARKSDFDAHWPEFYFKNQLN